MFSKRYCIELFLVFLSINLYAVIFNSRLDCLINWINNFNADVDLIQPFVDIRIISFILQKNIFIWATDFTLDTFL